MTSYTTRKFLSFYNQTAFSIEKVHLLFNFRKWETALKYESNSDIWTIVNQ